MLFVANPLAWTPTSFAEEKGFFRIRGATMASWRCSHRDQQLSNVSGPPGNLQDIPFAAMTPPPGTRAARNRNLRGGKAEVKTICRESQHNVGLGSNLDSCMCTENMIQIRGGVNPRLMPLPKGEPSFYPSQKWPISVRRCYAKTRTVLMFASRAVADSRFPLPFAAYIPLSAGCLSRKLSHKVAGRMVTSLPLRLGSSCREASNSTNQRAFTLRSLQRPSLGQKCRPSFLGNRGSEGSPPTGNRTGRMPGEQFSGKSLHLF